MVKTASHKNQEIGERIRYYRRKEEITIETLAEKIGISYQELEKYEAGKTCIPASILPDIAYHLDVSVLYLLAYFNDPIIEELEKKFCTSSKWYTDKRSNTDMKTPKE